MYIHMCMQYYVYTLVCMYVASFYNYVSVSTYVRVCVYVCVCECDCW